jgi:queuosine precursor transporter
VLYLWLAGLFVASLVVADLIGGKVFRVWGLDLSCGMLAFPITFVLTDVLNEFYGARMTKRVTYVGLGAAVLAFAVINVALRVPTSPQSPLSAAEFDKVFGLSARLYIASLTAYTLGQLADIAVFTSLRRLTGERLLWLRATGSTLVSQAIDTAVVTTVFWVALKPWDFIIKMAAVSYMVKFVIAVGMTPVIYAVHALVLRVIKVEEVSEDLGGGASTG